MAVELNYTLSTPQTVEANDNILFNNTSTCCKNGYVVHREGAGIVTLKGATPNCFSRYRVNFGANIAVAVGETVGPISLDISLNGEPLGLETIVTPAAVGDFFNTSRSTFVDVPKGCCYTIAVTNTSDEDVAIDVLNANLIVERVC